jgi:hypothetical protein
VNFEVEIGAGVEGAVMAIADWEFATLRAIAKLDATADKGCMVLNMTTISRLIE